MKQRSGPVVATVHPLSIKTHGESWGLVEIALPPPPRPRDSQLASLCIYLWN